MCHCILAQRAFTANEDILNRLFCGEFRLRFVDSLKLLPLCSRPSCRWRIRRAAYELFFLVIDDYLDGFCPVIDLAKLPIEVAGSSILARRSYLAQNPEIALKFLKAWIEGVFLFRAKPEFSLGVLKKYVATQDPEVLSAIYELNKQQLSTKPVPYVRVVKSMMQLLARTRPDLPNANPEGFVEPRFINELERAGFFEEMSRQYG